MLRRLIISICVGFVCAGASAANDDSKAKHVLVQTTRNLTETDRAELEAAGLKIGKPVPGGKFLARIEPGSRAKNDARIAAIEPIAADRKIHKSAHREAGRAKAFAELRVFFHDDVTLDDARAALSEAGGSFEALQSELGYGRQIKVKLPGNKLAALANDDRVKTITDAVVRRKKSRNATSAALSRVTDVQASPYFLTGYNVDLSLFEVLDYDGIQRTHPDFGGRVTTYPLPYFNLYDDHATHVAGTMGGSGLGNAAAKGMAPESTLSLLSVEGDHEDILWKKETSANQLDITADNNSWGYILGWDYYGGTWNWEELEEYMGAYDLFYTAPLDAIAIQENILYVHSAGNEGLTPNLGVNGEHRHYSTGNTKWCFSQPNIGCPYPCAGGIYCETVPHPANTPWTTIGDMESAKNILTVGAVDANKNLASFSSRGPALDGRVKPELVARGVSVLSTVPTDAYSHMSGTSMAAPVVTGIAGLLTEQWRLTYGGDPLMTTLKTLMIAGAEDLGNPGPDYSYGFGLVDAKAAVDLILEDDRILIGALAEGTSIFNNITLASPQNLRIVLGWADPDIEFLGGDEIAAVALVNDLDVFVIGPDGTVTYPYILDKNNPSAAATRGPNRTDNVEMIEIPNAAAGTYRVVVRGADINDASPQEYVLVANAGVSDPVGQPIALTATGSGAPSVSVSWTAVGTGTTYDVYRRTGPGGATLLVSGLTSPSYVDDDVDANSAYAYHVNAYLTGGGMVLSNADLATTVTFDPTLAAGSPIQVAHINQLTTVANAVRALAGLGAISFTNAPAAGAAIRASQMTELRAGITAARTTLALPAAAFSRTVTSGLAVQATDFTEVRSALQ